MGQTAKRMPTYFISHGGGPWPWVERFNVALKELRRSLEAMPNELPQTPKAILIITGHWEENGFAISSNPKPGMIYDYGGFPEHTYHIQYPAPGSPDLAAQVQELLKSRGIEARLDSTRGYDHGTFVPLAVSYPRADIPVVQLSVRRDYDPEAHLALGRALAPLRDEGVLIIGSGLSFHNLRMRGPEALKPSHEFDQWLQETLIKSSPAERTKRLISWEKAPSARTAHPEEDHLIPLMVAVGAAEEDDANICYHEDNCFGIFAASSFRFSKHG